MSECSDSSDSSDSRDSSDSCVSIEKTFFKQKSSFFFKWEEEKDQSDKIKKRLILRHSSIFFVQINKFLKWQNFKTRTKEKKTLIVTRLTTEFVKKIKKKYIITKLINLL